MIHPLRNIAPNLALAAGSLKDIGGVAGFLQKLPELNPEQQIEILDVVTPVIHQAGAGDADQAVFRLAGERSMLKRLLRATPRQIKPEMIQLLHDRKAVLSTLETPPYSRAAERLTCLVTGAIKPDIHASYTNDPPAWRYLPRGVQMELRRHCEHFSMLSLIHVSKRYHADELRERLAHKLGPIYSLVDYINFLQEAGEKMPAEEWQEEMEDLNLAVPWVVGLLNMFIQVRPEDPDLVAAFFQVVKKQHKQPFPEAFPGEKQRTVREFFSNIINGLQGWNQLIPADHPNRVAETMIASIEELFAPMLGRGYFVRRFFRRLLKRLRQST